MDQLTINIKTLQQKATCLVSNFLKCRLYRNETRNTYLYSARTANLRFPTWFDFL